MESEQVLNRYELAVRAQSLHLHKELQRGKALPMTLREFGTCEICGEQDADRMYRIGLAVC